MANQFRVDQIDHVELCVSDRYAAADWYRRVLGLEIAREFERWAEDPRGPLMIRTAFGGTKLALFEGTPEGSRRNTGFHLVAFRVNAASFRAFLTRLPELGLVDNESRAVTAQRVSDHDTALSIYFCDPYGNQLELTTYEYEAAKKALCLE